ncbi:hypothetical protein MRY82_05635 [bacterium]|nr:hypothetical protein [bacterium]
MHLEDKSTNDYELLLEELKSNNIFNRLQQKDPTLWSSELTKQHAISNRLGWVESDQVINNSKEKVSAFYEKIKKSNYLDFVWVGMGGSSLFAKTLVHVYEAEHFHIIDSTDTQHIHDCLSRVDLPNTLFFIASKSGSTLETMSVFKYLQKLNIPDHHFVSVSDANTSLSQHFALSQHNFYDQFITPDDIGGRFSSISYFGLLPFALINFTALNENIDCFLKYAKGQNLQKQIEQFTAKVFQLYQNYGSNKLILHLPDQLSYFTHWVEQLIAESTGKNNCGFIPLPSQYIDNDRKDYIHINTDTNLALSNTFSHMLTFPLTAKQNNLLLQSYIWMQITAILGYFLKLNPFDEPNVALSKSLAHDYLKQVNLKPEDPTATTPKVFFEELDKLCHKNQMIAVLFFGFGYKNKLEKLCQHLSKTYCQPCIPYPGPQYLHSVGQYFKGGHLDVSFIIVYGDNPDVSEEQAQLEKIKLAQSLGDFHALRQLKKPVFFIKHDQLFKLFAID